jgi:Mannose-6-phosphate isomerase
LNIFKLPSVLPDQEVFEQLIPDHGVLIERIISTGQASPSNFWYDQDRDEWVTLLQGFASIKWKDGHKQDLVAGDTVFIPAHEVHRVEKTSVSPPCIWLAVHGKLR